MWVHAITRMRTYMHVSVSSYHDTIGIYHTQIRFKTREDLSVLFMQCYIVEFIYDNTTLNKKLRNKEPFFILSL